MVPRAESPFDLDLAIVGGGAAGLAAAIFAGEAAQGSGLRIALLEGARKPGAKILVSGGGRCNVTNETVTPDDFNGGSPNIVRKVLKSFDERRTVEWMRALGVELKREPTGKLFPVTDKARTVLNALLQRVEELGVSFRPGSRVARIAAQSGGGFRIELREGGTLVARRAIVATGGLSLPKSGSDGQGLGWMRTLGHTIVPTVPALAPLTLAHVGDGVALPQLDATQWSGVSLEGELRFSPGPRESAVHYAGAVLFTHFGISGPAPMNLSRHLAVHRREAGAQGNLPIMLANPAFRGNANEAERWLLDRVRESPKRHVAAAFEEHYPASVARVLAGENEKLAELTKERRRVVAGLLAAIPMQCSGDRGYAFAETTAGGVDLREIDARTMESRVVAGMHLCGEMLDVDGRIGGFNFQWAWSSGFLAGRGAVRALLETSRAEAIPS